MSYPKFCLTLALCLAPPLMKNSGFVIQRKCLLICIYNSSKNPLKNQFEQKLLIILIQNRTPI